MRFWASVLCGLVTLVASGCVAGLDLGDVFSGGEEEAKSDWGSYATYTTYEVPIVSVAFSPDGKAIATGHWYAESTGTRVSRTGTPPGRIQLWKLDFDNSLSPLSDVGSTTIEGLTFERVRFTPDSQHVCVHARHRVYDPGSDESELQHEVVAWNTETLQVKRRAVSNWGPISDDARLTTENEGDSTIVIRVLATNAVQVRLKGDAPQTALAFSEDARLLAASTGNPGGGRTIDIWDCESGTRICMLIADLAPVDHYMTSRFSPDGEQFAVASERNYGIRVVKTANGSSVNTLDPGFKGEYTAVQRLAFSPDGRLLAAALEADDAGEIRVWNVETGELVTTIADPAIWGFTAVAFSPDGRHLATGDPDGMLRLFAVPEEHWPARR